MIEVRNLTKRYGAKTAVDDISFTVAGGEILGFLGPNGAGKTTTMNIITGYLSSNGGSVSVGGYEILTDPIKVKGMIGYLPEQPPLYMDMTVGEYLSFMYDLKKVKGRKKSHIDEVCGLAGVGDVKKRLIRNLSKGYRQRVGLSQALLGNPPVLILDEPTIGLDPKQIIEMRALIQELGRQHTVILSSHILPEIQAVCKRIVIIHQGRLVADGTPDAIARSLSGERRLLIRVMGPEDQVGDMLAALPGVSGVEPLGSLEENSFDFSLEISGQRDIRSDVFFSLAEKKWPLLYMRSSELSLEDVFLRLTAGQNVLTDVEEAADEVNGSVGDANGSVSDANDSADEVNGSVGDANDSVDEANDSVGEANDSVDEANDSAEGGDA